MSTPSQQIRFTDTTASVLLDLARGLAALLVLSVHLRNMLFIDYPQAIERGASKLLAIPYVLTSGGHQAVVIFFVLSGYLVGGSVLRSLSQGQWRWSSYLLHRLVRLWIVLLPGLLLCFLWDSIGLRSHSLLYHGILPNYETGDISRLQTIKAFVGNLFFLQPMLVSTYGSDGPLWSLAYEFWYYLLFPLGLIPLRSEFSWKTRVCCFLSFLVCAWFVHSSILEMFPVWILGVMLTRIPTLTVSLSVRYLAVLIYLPLVFYFSRASRLPLLIEDYLFALLSAGFLWIVLSARGRADETGCLTRSARGLSRFSYTLYVVHQPFVLLAASFLIGTERWFPNMRHIVEGMCLLLGTLAYSQIIAVFTEYRTEKVRRWIERFLEVSSSRKAQVP